MNTKFVVMLSAAFGGISPNLLRLAVNLMGEGSELPQVSYLLGLSIFAIIGAVIALIWEETDFKKAFYLGIGLPALIQTSAGEISSLEEASLIEQTSSSYLASSHHITTDDYAIIPVAWPPEQKNKLKLTINKFYKDCQILFIAADGSTKKSIAFTSKSLSQVINVPASATAFKVKIGQFVSKSQSLTKAKSDESLEIHFQVMVNKGKDIWDGLWKSIGFREKKHLDIKLKQKK